MRQSTVIFATLLFAFVIYITLRGQLPAYVALFSSKPYSGKAEASNANDGGVAQALNNLSDVANRYVTLPRFG